MLFLVQDLQEEAAAQSDDIGGASGAGGGGALAADRVATIADRTNRLANCSICWESLTEKVAESLACSHVFHKECIDGLVKTNGKCALCRAQITGRRRVRLV